MAPQALLEIQAYKDPLAYPGRARMDRTVILDSRELKDSPARRANPDPRDFRGFQGTGVLQEKAKLDPRDLQGQMVQLDRRA